VKTERNYRETDKRKCSLCLGEEDIRQILLSCAETRKRRREFLNKKWLNMSAEVAYKNILKCTKKMIADLSIYLDKVMPCHGSGG
jgi:hypothetical protein